MADTPRRWGSTRWEGNSDVEKARTHFSPIDCEASLNCKCVFILLNPSAKSMMILQTEIGWRIAKFVRRLRIQRQIQRTEKRCIGPP
jgi:hypothetical protein